MREIKTKKVKEVLKIDPMIRGKIKDAGLTRRVIFMKSELIDCPLHKEEIVAITCMVCPHYVRRIKGVVHCKYDETCDT